MKKKLQELRYFYIKETNKIDDFVLHSASSEKAIIRMLIEKNCYLKFVKQLGKIIIEDGSISDSETK